MDRYTVKDQYGHIRARNNNIDKAIKKLFEYENAEVQGFLKILPCRLGDIPYWISEEDDNGNERLTIVKDVPITGITIRADGLYISTEKEVEVGSKIGSRYALLTKEDAEQKLKEMEAFNNENL